MKRKADIGLATLIVLAFFAAYLLWQPAGPEPAPRLPVETSGGVVAGDVGIDVTTVGDAKDPDTTETRGDPARAEPVRRIAHVPPPNDSVEDEWKAAYADLMAVRAEKLPAFARGWLDEALLNDLEAGLMAVESRGRCMLVPTDEWQLELRVDELWAVADATLRRTGAIENGTGDSPRHLFPSHEETRAHQVRWFHACRELTGLFESGYRERIRQMAQNGHVVARYLYALWPPPDGLKMDDFLAWQRWQSTASHFSMQNLEAGEAAGMLAFAQAYSSSPIGTFVPSRDINRLRALAFYIAARDCGFESDRLQSMIDVYVTVRVPAETAPESGFGEILSLAEEIATLCR